MFTSTWPFDHVSSAAPTPAAATLIASVTGAHIGEHRNGSREATTMRIVVVGAGYVGLAMATLLAQRHAVTCCDIDEDRVAQLNRRRSPIADDDIQRYLDLDGLDLDFVTDATAAYPAADYVVVATPTDYRADTGCFDTSSVSAVAHQALRLALRATVVIKSTVPVGYTDSLCRTYRTDRVVFAPEFLREGRALHDNLFPTRIVVGGSGGARATGFAAMVRELALSTDVPVLRMSNTEAEAVKLFANTYLAMRVAYFNELDSFALHHDLDPRSIVDGVCLDPRIGDGYNNPSFGYGGYCLPKDTKQLLGSYRGVPQAIVTAVVESNARRAEVIAADIVRRSPGIVGVYRLSMKAESDNFRESSVLAVIARLLDEGIKVVIYEPKLPGDVYQDAPVMHDFEDFAAMCDLIVANRMSEELEPVRGKVYSRDLFGVN